MQITSVYNFALGLKYLMGGPSASTSAKIYCYFVLSILSVVIRHPLPQCKLHEGRDHICLIENYILRVLDI